MAKKKVLNPRHYRVMKSFVMICEEVEPYKGGKNSIRLMNLRCEYKGEYYEKNGSGSTGV